LDCRDEGTGELLATGRHTKYLPMPFAYEFMFERLFPFVDVMSSTFGREASRNASAIEGARGRGLMEHVGELKWDKIEGGNATDFKVLVAHMNPMGAMHGGCQSFVAQMAAEEVIRGGGHNVKEMNMTYMSTGKGDIRVEAMGAGEGEVKVTMRRRKGGGIVSEGVFKY